METQQQAQSKKFKVLVIGDSCIDEYIYGDVERLNPEAPVPILNRVTKETREGMARNVAANLKSFGCDVDVITNIEKIIKTRYIDRKSKQQLLRVDSETKVTPIDLVKTKGYDAVVISDYDKGFVNSKLINTVANTSDCPVFLDTKKRDLNSFEGCIVKINEIEYKNRLSDCSELIVTLGSKGAKYKDELFGAPEVDVSDVCGAGDTFLAALCCSYLRTDDIRRSIQYANRAAGIAVQHSGSYVLTEEDVACINSLPQ